MHSETAASGSAISIIFPTHRGVKNVPILLERIEAAMEGVPRQYEILAVDDGSVDGTFGILKDRAAKNARLKVVRFRANKGQTAALRAGIDYASGAVLVLMDSDLENDPQDIPRLLQKLDEGYDVVSGWRKKRWSGQFVRRKLPSVAANRLISWITGIPLHDWGCTLKAYRREVIEDIPLYGEMHRFIPAYAAERGARITEIPVNYERRRFGKSNYGISRTFRVLLDLLLMRFLERYLNRPIHFFGAVGFFFFLLGALSGLWAIALRVFEGLHFVRTPLPILAVFFLIAGLMAIMIGVLAEMVMRTYYAASGGKQYQVAETINL